MEERQFLQEGAERSVPVMRAQWDARVENARHRVAAAGANIVEDLDQDAFEKAMTPVWERFVVSPKMESLVDQIKRVYPAQPVEASSND